MAGNREFPRWRYLLMQLVLCALLVGTTALAWAVGRYRIAKAATEWTGPLELEPGVVAIETPLTWSRSSQQPVMFIEPERRTVLGERVNYPRTITYTVLEIGLDVDTRPSALLSFAGLHESNPVPINVGGLPGASVTVPFSPSEGGDGQSGKLKHYKMIAVATQTRPNRIVGLFIVLEITGQPGPQDKKLLGEICDHVTWHAAP